ncbi:MAG: MarR family transcriptional regulator [Desulfarculus sp.]|nr:MarR family transcriptional regulator [Pseudomonadota bacterium]MBU4576101.1 MarR family transcriptional regulator [Pseudomonadota bacterium]MBU4600396.1 MarR family transcriptional regulator [Pseudomonadota bacterium]MBV1715697.1 MarR family transcriptional regulator [Desulfarculus sp.]MBV1740402.1 MarR family transcriptional regulator [Desulfarculus sp.]
MSTDENILRSIRRIIRATDLHSRRLASEHRLTTPQLLCLRLLAQEGPLTPGAVAKEMYLSQATVTGILDRLEKRRLVERRRDQADRRKVSLHLTQEGITAVKQAPLPLHERFASRLEALTAAERDEIERVLDKVVELMEAQEVDAAPLIAPGDLGASAKTGQDKDESEPN